MRRVGMIGMAGKLALATGFAALAAGCSTQPGTGGPGNTLSNLLLFNSTTAPPPKTSAQQAPPIHLTCPQIEVQDGTSSVRVFNGADQSSANLRYQFSLDNVARDCQLANGQLAIKVGVAGRVLAGPAGAPSSFTVPVRVVISAAKATSSLRFRSFIASPRPFPPANRQPTSPSSRIRSSVPYVHEDADDDYTVLVGFDQGSAASEKAPAKRRKRS